MCECGHAELAHDTTGCLVTKPGQKCPCARFTLRWAIVPAVKVYESMGGYDEDTDTQIPPHTYISDRWTPSRASRLEGWSLGYSLDPGE